MAAGASTTDKVKTESRLQRITRTRAFKLAVLAANIVLPLAVVGLMYFGAASVHESRERVRQAQAELQEALQKRDAAVKAAKRAIAEKETVEKETAALLAKQNQIREENARLSQKPNEVIARIRSELGGLTPTIRADSLYKRGRDAFAEGNMQLAHALYTAALQEDERYIWALIGMGSVALSNKNYLVAEKHFKRAVQEDPNNKIATYNLASVSAHKRLSKWEQAREYARKTLEIDPNHERAKELLRQLEDR